MRRTLIVVTMAALFVAVMIFMAFPALGDTSNLCTNNPENKNCDTRNKGGQEGGCDKNGGQNCKTVRINP